MCQCGFSSPAPFRSCYAVAVRSLESAGALLSSLPLLCALSAGCGTEPIPPGKVQLTIGQESDTWTREPAPTTVDIEKWLVNGDQVHLKTVDAPAAGFTLDSGDIGQYEVIGRDASGTVQVRGRSVFLDPRGFAGTTTSLFVGRAGDFSRPPGNFQLTEPGDAPVASLLASRYIVTAIPQTDVGIQTDGYDLGFWLPVNRSPIIPCRAPCTVTSLASIYVQALRSWQLLVLGDDWAVTYDVSADVTTNVKLPTGMTSFAEVAGGRTIAAPDGSVYIVGATRPSSPTSSVLAYTQAAGLHVISLLGARAGAAATWVEGHGLLVAGGSETAAGAELLAEGASAFTALGYPPDPTAGAGLGPLSSARVLRSGGHNPDGSAAATVELSLACGSACAATPRSAVVELDQAQSFAFDDRVLTVGTTADGETRGAFIDGDQVTILSLREPRRHGTVLGLPTGQVAVVGGTRISDNVATQSLEFFTRR